LCSISPLSLISSKTKLHLLYPSTTVRLKLKSVFLDSTQLDSRTTGSIIMVGFKNRYMVMEVFLDPSKDHSKDDSIIISEYNVSKAIKDSILTNYGEYGLAASLGSFKIKYVNPITKLCIIRASREEYQKVWSSITMVRSIGNCPVIFNLLDLSGNIEASKKTALKCEEAKFNQYKQLMGDLVTPETTQRMQNCFEKIRILEN
ncbi:hypothetical protein GIB67_039242, partial [Kingdonia uniflora]